MIAIDAREAAGSAAIQPPGHSSGSFGAFLAICRRDLFVTSHQLPLFLIQVLLQPAFLVFTFGKILPALGLASAGYATVLIPGVLVLTVVLTSLQQVALPLVLEFGYTREIDDRLLAPLPVPLVGVQKIVVGTAKGLVAGAAIFPLSRLIIGSSLHLSTEHIALTVVGCILAAALGSSMGLMLGTIVQPSQISIMFALILTPLLYTGCTQYPWSLLGPLKWYQVATLLNPMTYASELMRAALAPGIDHMSLAAALPVLCVVIVLFSTIGVQGFIRRSVD